MQKKHAFCQHSSPLGFYCFTVSSKKLLSSLNVSDIRGYELIEHPTYTYSIVVALLFGLNINGQIKGYFMYENLQLTWFLAWCASNTNFKTVCFFTARLQPLISHYVYCSIDQSQEVTSAHLTSFEFCYLKTITCHALPRIRGLLYYSFYETCTCIKQSYITELPGRPMCGLIKNFHKRNTK